MDNITFDLYYLVGKANPNYENAINSLEPQGETVKRLLGGDPFGPRSTDSISAAYALGEDFSGILNEACVNIQSLVYTDGLEVRTIPSFHYPIEGFDTIIAVSAGFLAETPEQAVEGFQKFIEYAWVPDYITSSDGHVLRQFQQILGEDESLSFREHQQLPNFVTNFLNKIFTRKSPIKVDTKPIDALTIYKPGELNYALQQRVQ